jgi:hypothetical protein
MEKLSGKIKTSFVYYLSLAALVLLLGAIFLTIQNAMQQQHLRSKAALTSIATLPPGSALPTDAECAAQVIKTPEQIPENQQANAANVFTQGYRLTGSLLGQYGGAYESRVTGNFTGTTDEILQWGACKWGFDADTGKAIAVGLSKWKQTALADCNNQGQIQPETNGCQSVGIMRVKSATIPPAHPGTWPYAKTSTAFNVDYALAFIRACYEGKQTLLGAGYQAGDEWGCIGAWYSGFWHDGSAEGFILGVQDIKTNKEWLTYGSGISPAVSSIPNPTQPVVITPTFGMIVPCPSCSTPSVTIMPSTVAVIPTTQVTNTAPTIDPCLAEGSSLAHDKKKKKSKHKNEQGGVSKFMQALFLFLIELLNMIFELFGGGTIPTPNPTPIPSPNPTSGENPQPTNPLPNPCPTTSVPTTAPVPTAAPSSATPSLTIVSGVPTTMPSQTTNPTAPFTSVPTQVFACIPSGQKCDATGAKKCCTACVANINPNFPNDPGTCD